MNAHREKGKIVIDLSPDYPVEVAFVLLPKKRVKEIWRATTSEEIKVVEVPQEVAKKAEREAINFAFPSLF